MSLPTVICVGIERGPLVYCAEGADNGGKVFDKVLAGKLAIFRPIGKPDLLGGVTAIQCPPRPKTKTFLTLVPYYAWCHRGPDEMRVWFPTGQTAKSAFPRIPSRAKSFVFAATQLPEASK
jgi:DUF1680 family protein